MFSASVGNCTVVTGFSMNFEFFYSSQTGSQSHSTVNFHTAETGISDSFLGTTIQPYDSLHVKNAKIPHVYTKQTAAKEG
jgi:hypothetical protein